MLPVLELSLPVFIMVTLVSIACGWLGSFFVLQGKSLVSDAMSHTVLPGIVIAFLLTGSKQLPVVLLGAFLASYLTSYAIDFIAKNSIVQHETATAVVLTVSFSVGIALLSKYGKNIDLDQECVLFGEVGYIALEPVLLKLGSLKLGITTTTMFALTILIIILISLMLYRLTLVSFDSTLAQSLGINPNHYHNLLTFLLSATLVTAFESVGAILSVALVIIPPSTAKLLSNRIPGILAWVTIISIFMAYLGTYASYYWNLSTGGVVASGHGILFFTVLLLTGPLKDSLSHISSNNQKENSTP